MFCCDLNFFFIFENSKEYFAILNKFTGGHHVHVCSFLNFGVKRTCVYIYYRGLWLEEARDWANYEVQST